MMDRKVETASGFTSEELADLIRRADDCATIHNFDSRWRRVYQRIGDALCELHAYMERATVDVREGQAGNGIAGKNNSPRYQ